MIHLFINLLIYLQVNFGETSVDCYEIKRIPSVSSFSSYSRSSTSSSSSSSSSFTKTPKKNDKEISSNAYCRKNNNNEDDSHSNDENNEKYSHFRSDIKPGSSSVLLSDPSEFLCLDFTVDLDAASDRNGR